MYVHLREITEENDESVSWLNEIQDLIVTINKKRSLILYKFVSFFFVKCQHYYNSWMYFDIILPCNESIRICDG